MRLTILIQVQFVKIFIRMFEEELFQSDQSSEYSQESSQSLDQNQKMLSNIDIVHLSELLHREWIGNYSSKVRTIILYYPILKEIEKYAERLNPIYNFQKRLLLQVKDQVKRFANNINQSLYPLNYSKNPTKFTYRYALEYKSLMPFDIKTAQVILTQITYLLVWFHNELFVWTSYSTIILKIMRIVNTYDQERSKFLLTFFANTEYLVDKLVSLEQMLFSFMKEINFFQSSFWDNYELIKKVYQGEVTSTFEKIYLQIKVFFKFSRRPIVEYEAMQILVEHFPDGKKTFYQISQNIKYAKHSLRYFMEQNNLIDEYQRKFDRMVKKFSKSAINIEYFWKYCNEIAPIYYSIK